ncbi:hypothetical protein AAVH_41800, partial [Aphelenchoides avenae]
SRPLVSNRLRYRINVVLLLAHAGATCLYLLIFACGFRLLRQMEVDTAHMFMLVLASSGTLLS